MRGYFLLTFASWWWGRDLSALGCSFSTPCTFLGEPDPHLSTDGLQQLQLAATPETVPEQYQSLQYNGFPATTLLYGSSGRGRFLLFLLSALGVENRCRGRGQRHASCSTDRKVLQNRPYLSRVDTMDAYAYERQESCGSKTCPYPWEFWGPPCSQSYIALPCQV